MSFRKPTGLKDLLIHTAVIAGSFILLITTFFYVWLPINTNHGETITVPNIEGLSVNELDDFLRKRNLRFEVTPDSSYSPAFQPMAVLRQVPAPNTTVKENRKIYVTLNATKPPKVRMPKVEDLSLKSAQMVLRSYDLNLGEIKYVPDAFFGVVHEARMDGRVVLEGERIEKGSPIDLYVGDGYGNTIFQAPELIGRDLEEAKYVIIGTGLKVGKISITTKSQGTIAYRENGEEITETIRVSPGAVQNQYPKALQNLKVGDAVDLWVYKPDSVNNSPTILDN